MAAVSVPAPEDTAAIGTAAKLPRGRRRVDAVTLGLGV